MNGQAFAELFFMPSPLPAKLQIDVLQTDSEINVTRSDEDTKNWQCGPSLLRFFA